MEPIEKTEKLDHRHYIALLNNVKKRVDLAQQRLAATANEEMLRMYWDIGEMLHASQKSDGWGNKTLQRLSTDIKNEYSDVKGFSVRNLQCMIQFYLEYEKNLTSTKSKKSNCAISDCAIAHIAGQTPVMDSQYFANSKSKRHQRKILVYDTLLKIPLECPLSF